MKAKYIYILIMVVSHFSISYNANAQSFNPNDKIKGYISIADPIFTTDKNGITYNFDNGYTLSFPAGINIIKSKTIAYSFEFAPTIKTIQGVSKMSNFTFHPGIIFRRPNDFNILTRAAFETSGRFGATLVFNKVYYKSNDYAFWFAVPIPVRFGNNLPTSVSMALQFGFTF